MKERGDIEAVGLGSDKNNKKVYRDERKSCKDLDRRIRKEKMKLINSKLHLSVNSLFYDVCSGTTRFFIVFAKRYNMKKLEGEE